MSLPDMGDRHALFPMPDGSTNSSELPGKRTRGTAAQIEANTGPGWTGTLAEDATVHKSPTGTV